MDGEVEEMRIVIALAVLLVAAPGLAALTTHSATPGAGAFEYEPTRDIKWAQLPPVGGNVVSSQYDYLYPFYSESADDFGCDEDGQILSVEWWGNYWNGSPAPPEYFMIRFYSDDPGGPYSHPHQLLFEEACYDFNEELDLVLNDYHYFAELATPFVQACGNIYWVSVQAVMLFSPQWGWLECDPMYYWNDEAVMDFALLGIPRWTPMSHFGSYYELAFVLHGEFTPVEECGWGKIKALYR